MTRDHLLVIDQGTTSTRAVVYDARLQVVGQGQAEVLPKYPRSGWVEHDPEALVRSVGPQVRRALDESGVRADRLAAIGLTNQRETTIVWERASGKAIAPALVWQDRRTAFACDRLKDRQAWVSERTGLVIDPYFSATKIAWILDQVPDARRRAEAGELAAGLHFLPDGLPILGIAGDQQASLIGQGCVEAGQERGPERRRFGLGAAADR
jgi:glycerol kinase